MYRSFTTPADINIENMSIVQKISSVNIQDCNEFVEIGDPIIEPGTTFVWPSGAQLNQGYFLQSTLSGSTGVIVSAAGNSNLIMLTINVTADYSFIVASQSGLVVAAITTNLVMYVLRK